MAKVLNKYRDTIPDGAVDIMRPGPYGNHFIIGVHGKTREDVVKEYENSLDEEFKAKVRHELKGKDLVCCCAPKACHGDVLLKIANSNKEDE
jgi:hypothetical protein